MDRVGTSCIIQASGKFPIAKTVIGECFVAVSSSDTIIFSGYFFPNVEHNVFGTWVEEQRAEIRMECNKRVIVCGDFNSKNSAWGGCRTDSRGRLLDDAFSSLGLVCMNDGGLPDILCAWEMGL